MVKWNGGNMIIFVPKGKDDSNIISAYLNSDEGEPTYQAILAHLNNI